MPEIVQTLTHHGMGRTASGELIPNALPGEIVEMAETTSPEGNGAVTGPKSTLKRSLEVLLSSKKLYKEKRCV